MQMPNFRHGSMRLLAMYFIMIPMALKVILERGTILFSCLIAAA